MSKKKLNEATNLMRKLSKGTKSSKGNKTNKFEYYKKLEDGKTYGVIKEGSHYFIKHSDLPYKNPSKYEYIGGIMNKHKHCFDSLLEAKKRLNIMNNNFLVEKKYVIKKK